jgi:uncharacterized protein
MVDQKLLSILCCPETKQDVALVGEEVVRRINDRIKAGAVKNRGGDAVKDPIDGGLLRSDRKYLYPIREDIPIMLIDEALPFDDVAA